MNVKDLIKAIEQGKKEYKDFLDWDVAVETPFTIDTNMEKDMITDSEDWAYCKCHGFNTYMPTRKVFSVNIHY